MKFLFKEKFWFGFSILLVVIALISPLIPKYLFNINQYSDLSNFGQWWSGTSALFIALAGIILLVLNYITQKNELIETKRTSSIQQFEDTFFHFISFYNDIVKSLYYERKIPTMLKSYMLSEGAYVGKEFFYYFYHLLKSSLETPIKEVYKNDYEFVKATYNQFYRQNKKYFEHYFNTVIIILNFISKSKIKDKQFYFDIFKSQLSNYELLFLFYHGISNYSGDIKNILEEYNFLKNIDETQIELSHLSFYRQFQTET